MAAETASSIIRAALTADINLTADQLSELVKKKGIKVTPQSLKNLVYAIRSQVKKKSGKPAPSEKAATPVKAIPPAKVTAPVKAPAPAMAAARKTPKPKPSPRPTAPSPATPASSMDVSSVLSNVALVNKVVGLAGGPEHVKQVVDAVKACGGIEAFLQHLELVAGIRGDGTR